MHHQVQHLIIMSFFKVKKDYPLWSETEFLPGQIDSYGLWSMSEELASIKDIDKEFQGTLCLGKFIRKINLFLQKFFRKYINYPKFYF